MWQRRRQKNNFFSRSFSEFPLQSLVDWLTKAGVEKYEKDVLEEVIKYATKITGTEKDFF